MNKIKATLAVITVVAAVMNVKAGEAVSFETLYKAPAAVVGLPGKPASLAAAVPAAIPAVTRALGDKRAGKGVDERNGCSRLRKCSGVVWESVNGKWQKTAAGVPVNISYGGSFCVSAMSDNPGVRFNDTVEFIARVEKSGWNQLTEEVLGASTEYLVSGTFMNPLLSEPYAKTYQPLEAKFMGGSAIIGGKYYEAVCTE